MSGDRRLRDILVKPRKAVDAPGLEALHLGINLEEIYTFFNEQLPLSSGYLSADAKALFERKSSGARDGVLALKLEPKLAAYLLDVETCIEVGTISVEQSQQFAKSYSQVMTVIRSMLDGHRRFQLDVGVLGARSAWCARILANTYVLDPVSAVTYEKTFTVELQRVRGTLLSIVEAARAEGTLDKAFVGEPRRLLDRVLAALARSSERSALLALDDAFEQLIVFAGFGVGVAPVSAAAPAVAAGVNMPPAVASEAVRQGWESLKSGDLQEASSAFNTAVSIAEPAREHLVLASAYLGLARIESTVSGYATARERMYAERAYRAASAGNGFVVDALSLLIGHAAHLGEHARIEQYLAALEVARAKELGALRAYAAVLQLLSRKPFEMSAYAAAFSAFSTATAKLDPQTRRDLERQCIRRIAHSGLDFEGHVEAVADMLESVIAEAEAEGDTNEVIQSTVALVVVCVRTKPARVIEPARRALKLVDEMRKRVTAPDMQRQISGWAQMLALLCERVAIATGNLKEAFSAHETARARGALDQLALAACAPNVTVPPEMMARWVELRARDHAAFERLEDAANPERGTGASVSQWQQALRTRQEHFVEIERLIVNRGGSPGSRAYDMREIAAELPAGTAFVSFGPGHAYVITHEGAELVDLRHGQDLKPVIERYRATILAIAGGKEPPRGADPDDQVLFRALIEPLLPHLDAMKRLYLAPDEQLWSIPVHALGGLDGLCARFAVSYVFSGTMLARLLARPGQAAPSPFLGIADPDGSLPGARLEVQRASAQMPGGRVLTGDEATVEGVLAALPTARIVHLGCHGTYLDEFPELSYFKVAPGRDGDSRLEANAIIRTPMAADLVVLGACHSARGTVYGGGEFVGFPSAFLAAGARNVLGTLWSIDDEASAAFMAAFYEALPEVGPAGAMREAQIALRAEARWQHPYFWGAFQLHGLGDAGHVSAHASDAAPTVAGPTAEKLAEDAFERGMDFVRANDFVQAYHAFGEALEHVPSFRSALINRGMCAVQVGDGEAALPPLDKAVQVDPESPNARYWRGRARLLVGDARNAEADFTWFLAREDDGDTRFWRGKARSDLDNHVGCMIDLDQAVQFDASNAQAWYLRGYAQQSIGRSNDAIESFTKVLELKPDEIHTYVNRGFARGVRDPRGALADFRACLNARLAGQDGPDDIQSLRDNIAVIEGWIAPGRPTVQEVRTEAKAFAKAQRYEDAVEALSRACALAPEDRDLWTERAYWCEQAGKWAWARSTYTYLMGLEGDRAGLRHLRGRCALELGDIGAALNDFEVSLAKEENVFARYYKGQAHLRCGEAKEAVADLRVVATRKRGKVYLPELDADMYWYGRAQVEAEDFAGGVSALTEYIKASPRGLDAHYWRGWGHRRLGKNRQAVDDYSKSLERFPDNPQTWINRAYARKDLGEVPGAIADLEHAMRLNPALAGDLSATVAEWSGS